jgi:DNA invertase Pin-like site-specific DNA recombinase
MGKIYGYARDSILHQDLILQIESLKQAGVPVENIYLDKMTGKKFERESLKKLLSIVEPGDIIIVKKLDRLGRSVSQVTSIVDELSNKGIYLKSLDDNVDTSNDSPMAKAILQLFAMFAEMERNFILERTKPAIEEAKQKGVKFGAKRKKEKEYQLAVEMYLTGNYTVQEVLNKFSDLSEATFYRRLREAKKKLEQQGV